MERLYLLLPTLPKESKEQFNTDSTIHGTQATLLGNRATDVNIVDNLDLVGGGLGLLIPDST